MKPTFNAKHQVTFQILWLVPHWCIVDSQLLIMVPDSKIHGANMGPIWVLLAPDGPHVGPMNLDIKGVSFISHKKHNVAISNV